MPLIRRWGNFLFAALYCASLDLMSCLPSQRRREAIRAVISRREANPRREHEILPEHVLSSTQIHVKGGVEWPFYVKASLQVTHTKIVVYMLTLQS